MLLVRLSLRVRLYKPDKTSFFKQWACSLLHLFCRFIKVQKASLFLKLLLELLQECTSFFLLAVFILFLPFLLLYSHRMGIRLKLVPHCQCHIYSKSHSSQQQYTAFIHVNLVKLFTTEAVFSEPFQIFSSSPAPFFVNLSHFTFRLNWFISGAEVAF